MNLILCLLSVFTSIIDASFGSKVYVRGGKIDLLLTVLTPDCFLKWRYSYVMFFWDVVVQFYNSTEL